jgi:hypothetical protein
LQAAADPGIAAGLDDVVDAQGWVVAARPACKLRAYRQEAVAEQLDRLTFYTERNGGKARDGLLDALPRQSALGWSVPGFSFKGAYTLVAGLLALALLGHREAGKRGKRAR